MVFVFAGRGVRFAGVDVSAVVLVSGREASQFQVF